ncbi:MAG: hypothetical protein IIY45_06410 [Firmicutes bacterium]|nr:hypothetical protein [Bacillota bacterium]
MSLNYEVSLSTLQNLDWINVTDLEENVSNVMEVIDVCEWQQGLYILAVDTNDLSDDDFFEDEADEEEINDDIDAYILKLCSKEEAQFMIGEDESNLELYVTTDFPEEEFNAVSSILKDQADDEYELSTEE